MIKICPNCKGKLEKNIDYGADIKPSADWFCENCLINHFHVYIYYDSEVKEA